MSQVHVVLNVLYVIHTAAGWENVQCAQKSLILKVRRLPGVMSESFNLSGNLWFLNNSLT